MDWYKGKWPQTTLARIWEKDWYVQNVGHLPIEFPEGSEGHSQFTYNPRTKKGREYFASTFATLVRQNDKERKDSLGSRPIRRRRMHHSKKS